jgi:hypothetical protein
VKVNVSPRMGSDPTTAVFYRTLADQINGLSEGRQSARYAATIAAPTTGTWARGDTVDNSMPAELGAPLSKYVIDGWRCITAGTPGTWVQRRTLTGN